MSAAKHLGDAGKLFNISRRRYIDQIFRSERLTPFDKLIGFAMMSVANFTKRVSGLKTLWRRIRKAAGVSDFRFHDFRHDFGTKLLRETGNLKLVQRALNHADIKTTTRYAHVLDDEVAAALERVSESRKKSRTTTKRVS